MYSTKIFSIFQREDEFDNTQTYLVMIPGLDGLHSRFLNLSKRLKLPALAMQPGLDHLNETIQETANRFTKVGIFVSWTNFINISYPSEKQA